MLSLQRQRVIAGSLIGRPSSKKEQMLMVDLAGRDVLLAQRQVTLKDFERARAKLNAAILLRLVRSLSRRRTRALVTDNTALWAS